MNELIIMLKTPHSHVKMKTAGISIALIAVVIGDVFGRSLAPPRERLIKSENGLFVLRVHPRRPPWLSFDAQHTISFTL